MYRLENNVEWTEDLKSAFKHNVTRAKILYGAAEINENNNLSNLTLDEQRYISNLGFIGSATAKKVELNLVDSAGSINLENKEFILKIGADYNGDTYYINYGNFIVDKPPENDETNGTTKVVAYDYMIKFNQPFLSRVTYPCTLLTLLQDVCLQAGVELGSENFLNNDFIVENNQFEGNTLREVLQNIAKCAFSWARIGQDNKLYLDFDLAADLTETLTINDYKTNAFKKANEYYGPVNQVTYADSYVEGQEATVKDQASIDLNGLKELVIYDNLFAYTPEKRQALIQAGSLILGLRYMPISQLDSIGLAYLDCRDVINVETLDGNTYTSRVFNHTIKYNGALSDGIVTEGTSNNEEAYKNTANDIFQNQQTRIIVDKANKTITSVVENVAAQNTQISQIQQTVNEINSKISDIADITVSKETITGSLSFDNINQSEPIHIEIYPTGENISYLYPSVALFPANDLYIPFRRLRFTNTETSEVFEYELPDDLLYYNSTYYDKLILDYDSQTVYINKKCAYDASGSVVTLQQERTDEYPFPTIPLTDGDYTVEILKYEGVPYTAHMFCQLMAQNIYTTQFATKAEMHSEISQTATDITSTVSATYETKANANSTYATKTQLNTATSEIRQTTDSISATVSTKVGNNEVISKINQSPEEITINANKISLAGKTIDLTGQNISISSNNFSVDKYGNVTAKSGTFTGDLYMATNKKLASTSQGIMSTLFATGTGPIDGYEYLGYTADGTKLFRSSPMVGIYIPNNFTPVYAYLFIEQLSPTFVVEAGSTTGKASAMKVRKGSSGPSLTLPGFASEIFMNQNALSGTDITQTAFGSSTKVPNVGMTISNNIASRLSKGQLNVLSVYITDSSYDNATITWQGTEQLNAGRITGLAKLSIQVIGYLNPF